MADCVAVPVFSQYQVQKIQFKNNVVMTRNVYVRMLKRNYISWDAHLFTSIRVPLTLNGRRYLKENSLKCRCLRSFINSESADPSDLMFVVDQALLAISIMFTYLAGVIPQRRTFPGVANDNASQQNGAANSISYGRPIDFDVNYPWDEVKIKILEALKANECMGDLDDKAVGFENSGKTRPLNMFAVNEGPRLRLLWVTFNQLQKEVSNVSEACIFAGTDSWMVVATDIIKSSIQEISLKWLEEELMLRIGDPNSMVITRICQKLKGDDRILQNFNRSGKVELYSDLLFFLRFGSLRPGCCYDTKLMTKSGTEILEDLVIWLADGIASIYLELISVDGESSSEITSLGLSLCSLSTRALQRLRNELALNRWLQQNFESVISMYEDRFELYVLCRQQREIPDDNQEEVIWWKRLAFRKPAARSLVNCVHISPFSLPVKRTKELRALTGWRYYFSLFLELSDITMPFVRATCTKISNAVSFFLVYMIGRSVGLIFNGIRQSLGWRWMRRRKERGERGRE
ncbi:uncharacterized protein [Typha angustifolia]|uniref:uncharacterized protein isoform X2 n=2 Tax=Typha angustifolia TaxID=59011 RepID=UPI003C2FE1B3